MIDIKIHGETPTSYTASDLPRHARALALSGFKVFPLRPGDKRPLITKWQEQATNRLDQVLNWWSVTPNANIGIATGDGLTVIDIDTKDHNGGNGADGAKSLEEIELIYGDLNPTLTVQTWSGGKHLYYKTDAPQSNKVALWPGIDIRGDGGYIVAPGSIIQGRPYRIIGSTFTVEPGNDAVKELLKEESTYTNGSEPPPGTSDKLIPQGQRTDYLIKQCGALCDGTRSKETIKQLIAVINNTQLETPLTDRELEREVYPCIDRFKACTPKAVSNEQMAIAKGVNLVSFQELNYKTVDWLIPGYIPKGCITILGGDGGQGKTALWCNLVSAISCGNESILSRLALVNSKGISLVFSGEDDPESVLKKRLREYNADESKIYTLKLDDSALASITIGGELLPMLIEQYRPLLVVLDPIQQFIKDIDMSKRNDVRRTLQTLSTLGKKYGTSFLLVVHTNKRDKVASFRDKLSDSADLWDIARSVIAVGRTQDGNGFISQEKSSYSALNDTILFTFDGLTIKPTRTERKHYVELTTGHRQANKAQEKEDVKSDILYFLELNDNIEKRALLDHMQTNGHTANIINQAIKELKESEQIEIAKHADGYGNGVKAFIKLKKGKSNEEL